jgi:hypothetical protein
MLDVVIQATSASDWVELARYFGFPIILGAIIFWAGAKGIWVWGSTHRREMLRADRLEAIVLRSVGIAEVSTHVAKRLADETDQTKAVMGVDGDLLARLADLGRVVDKAREEGLI